MYLNDWADSGFEGMLQDFEYPGYGREVSEEARAKYEGIEVLLASYTYEDYEGEAFTLFRKDGQLYEVNGSHCSCYGLENQWEPEETTIASLEHRLESKHYYANGYKEELAQVIAQLKAEGNGQTTFRF